MKFEYIQTNKKKKNLICFVLCFDTSSVPTVSIIYYFIITSELGEWLAQYSIF